MTAGTVSQPGGVGTAYIVSGTHTYADSGDTTGTGNIGTYPIQVFIVDDDGSRLTVDNTANVADNSIVLTGQLNPASDSGLSTGTPNVTNVKQPDFFGKSEPLSNVTLSATLLPSGAPFIIGQVEAGSDGSWNIKSDIPLADGHYSITATAIDQFGQTIVTVPPSPVVINTNLLIDTAGPVVTGMFFNRLNGQVDYTIQDPVNPDGSAPSGVWVNYLARLVQLRAHQGPPQKNFPGKYFVSNVTATPDPTIPFAYDVAVTFNAGETIRGGFYLFTNPRLLQRRLLRAGPRREPSRRRLLRVVPLRQRNQRQRLRRRAPGVPQQGLRPADHHRNRQRRQRRRRRRTRQSDSQRRLRAGDPQGRRPIFSTTTSAVSAAKKGKGQVVVKAKHGAPLVTHHATKVVKHAKVVLGNNHPKGHAK